jgi:hypothetical protein
MAQFRATVQGHRGEASRFGGKASGITATANGWTSGVKVHGFVDDDGRDRFTIVATGGSNSADRGIIAEVIDGRVVVDPFGDFRPAHVAPQLVA